MARPSQSIPMGRLAGPFFLSVAHQGVARELAAQPAAPAAHSHAGAFVLPSRDALTAAVSAAYRLSSSLPTLALEIFRRDTATLGDTEADILARQRIGQDVFREALMAYWNGRCPMTGIIEPALLRASHIVPWAKCETDADRLDVHNGLLLSALWDSAFDGGFISFADDGTVIASPRLGAAAIKSLAVGEVPRLRLSPESRERMAWHRAHQFAVER